MALDWQHREDEWSANAAQRQGRHLTRKFLAGIYIKRLRRGFQRSLLRSLRVAKTSRVLNLTLNIAKNISEYRKQGYNHSHSSHIQSSSTVVTNFSRRKARWRIYRQWWISRRGSLRHHSKSWSLRTWPSPTNLTILPEEQRTSDHWSQVRMLRTCIIRKIVNLKITNPTEIIRLYK